MILSVLWAQRGKTVYSMCFYHTCCVCLKYSFILHVEHIGLAQWLNKVREILQRWIPYILESNPHPNIIRTSFCRFLKRKIKLVRGSNPHLSFKLPLHTAPSEVTRWVSAAWKAIPESIIVRSFKKCCISNALNVSKDDFLWEDDGVDKDDSDWVTTIQLWVMTASLMNNKL